MKPRLETSPAQRSCAARLLSVPARIALLASGLTTLSVRAQSAIPSGISGNPFLDWLWLLLGLVIIWFFFYSYLYPRLLPHFGETGSRAIFSSGWLLYSLTWIHLSFYTLFTFGFYHYWLQWSSLALLGLLSIWFLVSFARRG